jgi:hypothetical protein
MRTWNIVFATLFLVPAAAPAETRTADDIKKKLAEITAAPAKEPAGMAAERGAALRRLNAYRYLAGVPYDVTLDDDYNAACEAGAKLCAKMGRLAHTPENPGLPKEEFDLAFKGTSRSNLGAGYPTLSRALDGWMEDSDSGNIERLGHRRWCLNPAMQKTGFGRAGEFTAMYSIDMTRKTVRDDDVICWPARGPMPVEYFNKSGYGWSVSLNSRKYSKPGKDVEVKVYAADKNGDKVGEPLKINSFNVDTAFMGVPNCIIFRPEKAPVAAGRRYVVEIEGLTTLRDKKAAPLSYVVEFMSVK